MAHPEEINKVAKVQTQARGWQRERAARLFERARAAWRSRPAAAASPARPRVPRRAACTTAPRAGRTHAHQPHCTHARVCARFAALSLTLRCLQVSEVKEIMMQNIEKVLDRGEKLELLVDKTENLRYQADQFQKGGKALRNKMWWQNIKMKLMVFLIVAIVIVVRGLAWANVAFVSLCVRWRADGACGACADHLLLRVLQRRPQLRGQGEEGGISAAHAAGRRRPAARAAPGGAPGAAAGVAREYAAGRGRRAAPRAGAAAPGTTAGAASDAVAWLGSGFARARACKGARLYTNDTSIRTRARASSPARALGWRWAAALGA